MDGGRGVGVGVRVRVRVRVAVGVGVSMSVGVGVHPLIPHYNTTQQTRPKQQSVPRAMRDPSIAAPNQDITDRGHTFAPTGSAAAALSSAPTAAAAVRG